MTVMPDEQPLPTLDSPVEYSPQWSDWTRRAITVGLVIATVYALTLLQPVIQVLVTALLVAFLMYIPASFVARYTRFNFAASVIWLYLVLVALIMLFFVSFIPSFMRTVESIARDVQLRYVDVREYILAYEPGKDTIELFGTQIAIDPVVEPLRNLIVQLEPPALEIGPQPLNLATLAQSSPFNLEGAAPIISTFTSLLSSLVGSIGSISSSVFLAIFLSFLFLLELPKYQHGFMQSIPQAYQREMLLLVDKIYELWSGFFRGQGIIAIIIGVLTWLQLQVLGVPQASVLAVFTAIISLIPTIGGIIALVPLGLVPLLQGSTTLEISNVSVALLVVVGNLIISQIIWNAIAPRILGNVVSLPVPVIIVGVVIGAAIGGILGAFLIVPLLGTTRLVVLYLIAKINRRDPFPGEVPPYLEDLAKL